jgi:hypothetical protein
VPGEVLEDVAEGQECAVCMEKRQDSRLLPCGHTDLCYGCVFFCFFVVLDNDKIADYCPATTPTFALGEWLREHVH